jgi:hypothetical protein
MPDLFRPSQFADQDLVWRDHGTRRAPERVLRCKRWSLSSAAAAKRRRAGKPGNRCTSAGEQGISAFFKSVSEKPNGESDERVQER